MKHDPLADMFYVIWNTEKVGHKSCIVPASEMIKNILMVMQKHGFIGSFEFMEDGHGGKMCVELIGCINMARAIKPRFAVQKGAFEKWETRYLPAKGVGIIILSTPTGIMTHEEAKKQNIGGRLLGYVY